MRLGVFQSVIWLVTFLITSYSVQVFANPASHTVWTDVEKIFLSDSGRQWSYPHEYTAVIETRNKYELGRLTALRFIEWVQKNPNGVVALTTGNTPEFFIKYLSYYKKNWDNPKVKDELQKCGIISGSFPDTSNIKLVQVEEYFPLSSKHYKKVSNCIQRHYVKILGLKPENVLLMDFVNKGILAEKGQHVLFMNGKVDLSILQQEPNSQLESWQQQAVREIKAYCLQYENKIQQWGGIDFFLGSIGYGGHVGFNAPGTKITTPTHVLKLDYRTAAHAANDLGGIEHANGKLVVTIGLGTITQKPDVTLILLADGESKSTIVHKIAQTKFNIECPSTVLQRVANGRLYVSTGSAKKLTDRRTEDIKLSSKSGWDQGLLETVIIDIAQAENKEILALTEYDIARHAHGRILLDNPPKALDDMLQDVHNKIIAKIESGVNLAASKGKKVLHTAPHHNDIMLGYYAIMDSFTRRHKNHFGYLTSGFNSVSDDNILAALNRVSDSWITQEQDEIFKRSYEHSINSFKHFYAKKDHEKINYLETTIVLKHLAYIYDLKNPEQLKHTIRWLKDEYFPSKSPGDLDIPSIKLLKGMMRESESDRLWSLKNIPLQNITHFRSKFYSGREFTKSPRFDADVLPVINLCNDFQPDIITVNDDPQSAPPKTHYLVLQIIADALRSKKIEINPNIEILGYRNIWFDYDVSDVNVLVPLSEDLMKVQKSAFSYCFSTQVNPAFPSPFYEGEFCEISYSTQKNNLHKLKLLLGDKYFAEHPNEDIRNASGFIFFNKMALNEFFKRAADLHVARELEDSFYS